MYKPSEEKGQALLLVVVALTIAIVVILGVASRLILLQSDVSKTDTSAKALAAAEAGAERFLLLSDLALSEAVYTNTSSVSCPSSVATEQNGIWGCQIELPYSSDQIQTKAFVWVDDFVYNSSTGTHVRFSLSEGQLQEVNLTGYIPNNINICWSGESNIYYSSYSDTAGILRGGIHCQDCSLNSSDFSGFDAPDVVPGLEDFSRCRNVSLVSGFPEGRIGLRIRSVSGSSVVGIFPADDSLPRQGFVINSIGELLEQQETPIVRTLRVHRFSRYPSGLFDFSIFSNSGVLN